MTHNERVLALLSDGKPHSHHELYALHVIGHSRVADLRAQGHRIEQWREGELYFYRLLSEGDAVHSGTVAAPSATGEAARTSATPASLSLSEPVQLQLVPERHGAYHGGVCT